MTINARRYPYTNFMKSSSDDYKVDVHVGMSPYISYHHYYPCSGAFITAIPTWRDCMQRYYSIVHLHKLKIFTSSAATVNCILPKVPFLRAGHMLHV